MNDRPDLNEVGFGLPELRRWLGKETREAAEAAAVEEAGSALRLAVETDTYPFRGSWVTSPCT